MILTFMFLVVLDTQDSSTGEFCILFLVILKIWSIISNHYFFSPKYWVHPAIFLKVWASLFLFFACYFHICYHFSHTLFMFSSVIFQTVNQQSFHLFLKLSHSNIFLSSVMSCLPLWNHLDLCSTQCSLSINMMQHFVNISGMFLQFH